MGDDSKSESEMEGRFISMGSRVEMIKPQKMRRHSAFPAELRLNRGVEVDDIECGSTENDLGLKPIINDIRL